MFKSNFLYLCTGLLWRLVDDSLRDTQTDHTLRVVANIAQSVTSLETDYRKTRRRTIRATVECKSLHTLRTKWRRQTIYIYQQEKNNVQADFLTGSVEDCGFHSSKTEHLAWFVCEFAINFTQRYKTTRRSQFASFYFGQFTAAWKSPSLTKFEQWKDFST